LGARGAYIDDESGGDIYEGGGSGR